MIQFVNISYLFSQKPERKSTINSICYILYIYLIHFHRQRYLHGLLFLVVCVCMCANNYVNEAEATPNYRYTYLAAYRDAIYHLHTRPALACHANHLNAFFTLPFAGSRSPFLTPLSLSLSPSNANIELGADNVSNS